MDRLWEGVLAVMGCRLYGYGESASKDLSINFSLGAGICIALRDDGIGEGRCGGWRSTGVVVLFVCGCDDM
jgi:hypothetical protein